MSKLKRTSKTPKPAPAKAKRKQAVGAPLDGKLTVKNRTKAVKLLAAFRKAGGSLEQLAKTINVNSWTIYRWARGLNEPRALALNALKLAINMAAPQLPAGLGLVATANGGQSKVSAAQILDYIVSRGAEGATDDEIEAALHASHQTASARRRDLVVKGAIVASGQTRPTRSGRSASVWRAAPAPQ